MKTYARLFDDNRVAEVWRGDNIFEAFVVEIASQFIQAPEDTKVSDVKTETGWEKYVEPTPPEPQALERFLSEDSLKTFMVRDERIAYKAASQTDPIIDDFAEMIALRPRNMEAPEFIEAVDQLVVVEVLTAERAQELKDYNP